MKLKTLPWNRLVATVGLLVVAVTCAYVAFRPVERAPNDVIVGRLGTVEYEGYKWIVVTNGSQVSQLLPHPDCDKHRQREVELRAVVAEKESMDVARQ